MFSGFYVSMVIFVLLLSIGGILNKSMGIFKNIAMVLSVVSIVSLVGVFMLIMKVGVVGKERENIRHDTTC